MDRLLHEGLEAIKAHGGSYRTQEAHRDEIRTFVSDLRAAGFGVQKWENIKMSHVAAVVERWQDRGLAPATMKEYMSAVRIAAREHGNDRIANSGNADFGIPARTYINNVDKSLSQEAYQQAVDTLKASPDIRDNAVAAQLQLQRGLGLRSEESWKFAPDRDLLADGRAWITAGVKGGRERMLPAEVVQRPEAQAAIAYAREIQSQLDNKKSTIPQHLKENQWHDYYYRAVRSVGIKRAAGDGTAHGNRHAWAQARYKELTGFDARIKHASREEFVRAAGRAKGQQWLKIDRDARLQIKSELGHGPDRDDVVSQYLGSGSS